MTNKTPFKTLDTYSTEAYQLYNTLRAYTNYPRIEQDGYEDLDGKLYSLAFVSLIQNYLSIAENTTQFEDWDELILEMEIEMDKKEVLANYPQTEEDYNEHIWNVKELYKQNIIKDLKELYPTDSLLLKFFSSLYYLADDEYIPDLNLDMINFIDEL